MSRHRQRLFTQRLLALGSATTALTAALLVPVAQASPPVAAAADAPVHTSVAASAARSAEAYWTPERMRSAKPAPNPTGVATVSKPAPGLPGRSAPSTPVATNRPTAIIAGATAGEWTGPANAPPATTTGKVFFVGANGGNWECSASTVNSAGKDVVFTAGHCVAAGGTGRFHTSWIFVPAYRNGVAPYGRWSAAQLWALNGWLAGNDRTHDIGAAVMFASSSGQHIVDVVGGQGIEWNHPQVQFQYQFGYPVIGRFNGQTLQFCTGWSFNDGGHTGINCDMTEGASGGPWLAEFNGTFGYLDTVNSWVFWDANGVRFKWNGPYFGNNAANLFNAVANL
jgi:V8-like Glu-specific endopeptidase